MTVLSPTAEPAVGRQRADRQDGEQRDDRRQGEECERAEQASLAPGGAQKSRTETSSHLFAPTSHLFGCACPSGGLLEEPNRRDHAPLKRRSNPVWPTCVPSLWLRTWPTTKGMRTKIGPPKMLTGRTQPEAIRAIRCAGSALHRSARGDSGHVFGGQSTL